MTDPKSNRSLREVYERVYQKGEATFFSRFSQGADDSENDEVVLAAKDWSGLTVLDVGCGTGHTAARIAATGAAAVTGIDYAATAIAEADRAHRAENLRFCAMALDDWLEPVNVVISCGTLEHFDDPGATLRRMIEIAGVGGEVIVTCPYFLNIRGFVWMTLVKLLDVPMSLTDLYFISPFDIERWLEDTNHRLKGVVPFDFDRANGRRMLEDMEKRLTNALRDADLPNEQVPALMNWLADVVAYFERTGGPDLGGRNALYHIAPESP